MPAYTKINLSPDGTEGDGDPIKITDTSGNGTFIHDTLMLGTCPQQQLR